MSKRVSGRQTGDWSEKDRVRNKKKTLERVFFLIYLATGFVNGYEWDTQKGTRRSVVVRGMAGKHPQQDLDLRIWIKVPVAK
jgi:hypothetical protein